MLIPRVPSECKYRWSINASYLIHESNDAVAKQVQTKLNGYDMVECVSVKKC